MRILIIGGGISGLSAAFFLQRLLPSVEITISESTPRFGGQIWTFDGIDVGGEALISQRAPLMDLLDDLKLKSQLLSSDNSMSPRIYSPTKLLPLPEQSFMGVPSHMESIKAFLSPKEYERAVFLSRQKVIWNKNQDMSIAELIDNSLGSSTRTKVIDPLVSGVYAAATEHISVRYAMPLLAAALDQGTGTLLSAVQSIITPSATEVNSVLSQKPRISFTSLPRGLGSLVTALLEKIHAQYVLETNQLTYQAGSYQAVHSSMNKPFATMREYDAIILACRPAHTGKLLETIAPDIARSIAEIPLSSPIIVAAHTNVELSQISGILVPELYPDLRLKALTHISNKWPHLRERKIIRLSYGRYNPKNTSGTDTLPTREIIEQDLRILMGNSAQLHHAYSFSYPRSLPVIGPQKWKELTDIPKLLPETLAIAGAYIHGVGIPSCVQTGWEAASRIASIST